MKLEQWYTIATPFCFPHYHPDAWEDASETTKAFSEGQIIQEALVLLTQELCNFMQFLYSFKQDRHTSRMNCNQVAHAWILKAGAPGKSMVLLTRGAAQVVKKAGPKTACFFFNSVWKVRFWKLLSQIFSQLDPWWVWVEQHSHFRTMTEPCASDFWAYEAPFFFLKFPYFLARRRREKMGEKTECFFWACVLNVMKLMFQLRSERVSLPDPKLACKTS